MPANSRWDLIRRLRVKRQAKYCLCIVEKNRMLNIYVQNTHKIRAENEATLLAERYIQSVPGVRGQYFGI